ncbi:hypothetical protein TSACC_21266 [Terrimicrobium sacchariphilum]|uniref:LTXXQ motif family protein n=1 Tax=Terrimicrobium sacchariphilum TaxID=690879 RepID=A0A146G7H3_TERSA|nr:hypothetical protein [Terrimicrobium sacchariphilum]GAT32864.1 hypothetical protein TSACC_21266 [Terrimicrobium sacchariphilum]
MKIRILTLLAALALGLMPQAKAVTAAVEHPGSVPILLGIEKVRDELKLNSLQRAVLDSLRAEYKNAARQIVAANPTTPEQRLEAEKKLLALNDRYNERALSTLNTTQRAKFMKIERKVLGALVLYTPSVQKELALAPKQIQAIEKIRQSGLKQVGKINRKFEAGKIGYQERLDLLRARKMASSEALLKVLTPTQKAEFAKITSQQS